jgi:uncharacterized protein (TIGR02145 family)
MVLKNLYKSFPKIISLSFILIFVLFFISCETEREVKVLTTTLGDITLTSARVAGNIIDLGSGIDDHGHCWSIEENPTIADYKTALGLIAKTGQFISELQDLQSGTKYYVRAYVKSGVIVIYGEVDSFETYSLQDIDSNYYHAIVIGSQIWMKENLKATKYNDGNNIGLVTDRSIWDNLTYGAYCWYDNYEEYYLTYGALYNWYAVNTNKLCPVGWHVPSESEWTELINYLGGESVACGKLRESGTLRWYYYNVNASNQSGFTALPGGYRSSDNIYGYGNGFYSMGAEGFWWSSTEYDNLYANALHLYDGFMGSGVDRYNLQKKYGLSVRCLRD